MELQTKSIIELHKVDKRLDQIEEQKGDLPSLIEEQKKMMDFSKEMVTSCKEKIKSLEKDKSKNQIDLDDCKSLLDKYNKQIFQVKNNKGSYGSLDWKPITRKHIGYNLAKYFCPLIIFLRLPCLSNTFMSCIIV